MRLAKKLETAGITHETITVDRVNDFLTELPCSSRTRTNHRNHIRTLWRFAISVGMAQSIERPLKIFKCKKTPVIAWTLGQLAQLDRAAAARTGAFRISKCPRSLFWRTWVRVGYELGLRFRDLHSLHGSMIRGRAVYVVHAKTRTAQGRSIGLAAVDLIGQMLERSPDGSVFAWAAGITTVKAEFRLLLREAKLFGSCKYLRRSGASYCERDKVGSAQAYLGHRTAGMARYYIDETICETQAPTPPDFLLVPDD